MPWLAGTARGSTSSCVGSFWWWGPTQIGASLFHSIAIPTGIGRVNSKGSFATGRRHCYMAGNFTTNVVLTDNYRLWAQGIQAPTVVPTVALSGSGLTANMICYLAYYDEESDLWSPLSAGSAVLAAANQGILWSSFPTSPNPRVTHIGAWRSVDGGLPRLVWLRQVGVTSVQESTALGDLGEAFVDDFELFPRCRYNVIWHERQVMAGDDNHPDTIYLSLIGDYEKYSTLSLKTKSGQPAIGLLEVGGALFVICPRAIEIVTGWTEDDLAIEIVQHGHGGIGHHTNTKFHNYALVPSNLGPYLTDGSGWWPMFKDISTKWTDEYALRRAVYDVAWAAHDPVSQVAVIHVGGHTDTLNASGVGGLVDTCWVADYRPVVPEVGGSMVQPDWSYDVTTTPLTLEAGAALAVPYGRRADFYYGGGNGTVYRANPPSNDPAGVSPSEAKHRTGAMFFGDVGGDISQGKKFVGLDIFLQSEADAWTLNLYGGDEYAFPALVPSYTKTVPASVDGLFQPKTTHWFNLVANRVIGRALVVETKWAAGQFRGMQPYWLEGETQRPAASSGGV